MRKSFGEFFKQQVRDPDNKRLLEKMDALETVTEEGPKVRRKGLTFTHAEDVCGLDYDEVGSLSRQEWECASVYIVFAFQKEK
jgi:mRNA (guanine-N7-)-methyltransferase